MRTGSASFDWKGEPVKTAILPDLQRAAFEASAWAKLHASQLAMHLTAEQRIRLFRQIDRLHDVDEWLDGDQPMHRDSFVSFLRAMLKLKPQRWPGLGMTHDGYLLANWGIARDAISIEFLADDQVRWSLSRSLADDEVVRAAGTCPAFEIRHFITPYDPAHWFDAR